MPYTWKDDWRLPGPGDLWHPPEPVPIEESDEYALAATRITRRRDGRRQDTCLCPAYPFPHRLGGGRCPR